MAEPHPSTGILLVGHGTSSEVGTGQFLGLTRQLAERVAPLPVEPAFLELAQPDIASGVARLAERGAQSITVVPLLLFAAGHAKRDIPQAVAAAIARLPGPPIRMALAEHLGCHPAMVELSRQRCLEVLQGEVGFSAEVTGLVLVGRGSRDATATAEMHEFASLRHDARLACKTVVAFVAMAEPPVDAMLAMAARDRWRRVIVQPHLLFEGELVEGVRSGVARYACQHPDQEWLIAPLLADSQDSPISGNDYLLQAIHDRLEEAAIRVVAAGRDD